ncbi:MAG: hypothetical protein DHS20C11_12500 [Lysobacteraceae bacterium]|nr:MAG: hypothetical protein DHS20C11_12500 [Xanthomonadaceae bacterium]
MDSIPVETEDGHRSALSWCDAGDNTPVLFWVPALGVRAVHYQTFFAALAEQGISSLGYDYRGHGSSSIRASRAENWGYPTLLEIDLPAAWQASAGVRAGRASWLGGHSLGGQLAAIVAHRLSASGVIIHATGIPHWRSYGPVKGVGLWTVTWLLQSIAAVFGYYPGRRLGFGGREARSVMADWSSTVRSGQYLVERCSSDNEQALTSFTGRVLGLAMADDELVPESTLDQLLKRLVAADIEKHVLPGEAFAGGQARHFSTLKQPQPAAAQIARFMLAS